MLNDTRTQHYELQSRVRHSTLRTIGNSAALITPFCSETRSTRDLI